MRSETSKARRRDIEAVAYQVLARQGYEGTSMLAVAKAARASNETLYRWYGDKNGLFESMVRDNAAQVRKALDDMVTARQPPLAILARLAPVLLEMLLGDRAIALNRAAAARILSQRAAWPVTRAPGKANWQAWRQHRRKRSTPS